MMPKRVEKYFDLLEKVTRPMTPKVRNYRVSAMISIGKDIISFGHCKMKSHPLQKRFGANEESIYLHAELDALAAALREIHVDDLKQATLYVLRLKKVDGELIRANAKPCEGCQQAIDAFGFKRVYYTTEGGIKRL